MNSKQSKLFFNLSLLIFIILLVLVALELIPGIVALILISLVFIFITFILPSMIVNGIRSEYNKSFQEESLTERILIQPNDSNDINKSNSFKSIKLYPKKVLNNTLIMGSLAILLFINALIDDAILQITISIQGMDFFFILAGIFFVFALFSAFQVINKTIVFDNEGVKSSFTNNFYVNKNEKPIKILYSDIAEIKIKKNKYLYSKDLGIIFEFVLKDGTIKLLVSTIFSDKQRIKIIETLKLIFVEKME